MMPISYTAKKRRKAFIMWNKIKPFVVSIAISLGVGTLAGFLTRNSMSLYDEIVQPPLAPPSILFPIVWTILYILMGISAALIYTNEEASPKDKEKALTVYAASLIVNFFWSILFFNFRAFFISFLWLLLLLVLVIYTILLYHKINKVAAYLQIPYAVWVGFAGYLNLAIWILNR